MLFTLTLLHNTPLKILQLLYETFSLKIQFFSNIPVSFFFIQFVYIFYRFFIQYIIYLIII